MDICSFSFHCGGGDGCMILMEGKVQGVKGG